MGNNQLYINAVGDICPGEHYFSTGHGVLTKFRNGELQKSLSFLKKDLSTADIIIGNLEGVISPRSKYSNPIESKVFRGDIAFAGWLKELGFSHINIANNHFLQHGPEAANDAISALIEAGLTVIGRRCIQSDWHCEPVYVEIRTHKVGILAYSLIPERYEPNQNIYAEAADWQAVERDIRKLKEEVGLVIVSLHGGDEGLFFPNEEMAHACDRLSTAGANIVLGHHSHTLQGVKEEKHSLIFYSLGNFIFDMDWDERFGETAIAKIIADPLSQTISYSMSHYRYKNSLMTRHTAPKRNVQPVIGAEYTRVLSKFERFNQIKKSLFFFSHILRGDVEEKFNFIFSKIKKLVGQQ